MFERKKKEILFLNSKTWDKTGFLPHMHIYKSVCVCASMKRHHLFIMEERKPDGV